MEIMNNYGRPRYFKFKISNSGGDNGFIDSMQVNEYVDFEESKAGTLEQYTNKGLGYIRWISLCGLLSNFGIFFMEVDKLEGATSVDSPTSIEFTIGYEQTDALYLKLADGTVKKDIDVLYYLVAYCMSHDYKSFVHIYNPTILPTSNEVDADAPIGFEDVFKLAPKLCDSIESAMAYINIEEISMPDLNNKVEF